MHHPWNHWIESVQGLPVWCRQAWAWAAAVILWFDPSSGLATAILWGAGLYALWNWRKTMSAWCNPAGALFGLGVLWALASAAWSFDPAGTARDLVKSIPLVLVVWSLPGIFDRPGRIWTALVATAGVVTIRLGLDLFRVGYFLGWPSVLEAARFFHPYLYSHPNVTSMMAGLCVLVFVARGLAGAPGTWRKGLLVAGILLNLAYLVVMASRGPQIVFALAVLAFPLVLLPGWRTRALAAVLVAVLAAGLWQALPGINPRFRDRTMGSFNQRDKIWRHTRRLADRNPVLGYGFGKKSFVKAIYENPEWRPPRVHFKYPHAHSYWLMLYFQGGAVGFVLWSLGWLALAVRLGQFIGQAERRASGWPGRLRARVLPVLVGTGLAFILVYGLGDYPDNVIRQVQFYLAGLAMALTLPPVPRPQARA